MRGRSTKGNGEIAKEPKKRTANHEQRGQGGGNGERREKRGQEKKARERRGRPRESGEERGETVKGNLQGKGRRTSPRDEESAKGRCIQGRGSALRAGAYRRGEAR